MVPIGATQMSAHTLDPFCAFCGHQFLWSGFKSGFHGTDAGPIISHEKHEGVMAAVNMVRAPIGAFGVDSASGCFVFFVAINFGDLVQIDNPGGNWAGSFSCGTSIEATG